MKRLNTLTGVACIGMALGFSSISLANDAKHDRVEEVKKEAMEVRDDHYHVEPPKTAEAANALLKETLAKVEAAYDKGQYEELHKASYALEASVDAFRALHAHQANLVDELDESVQTIHYASEQEDAEVLDALMPNLRKSANNVLNDKS